MPTPKQPLSPLFAEKIAAISANLKQSDINNLRRGVEKESLRVTPDGTLASTPHPQALGAALTHPSITTDYSEALLEFITEPHTDIPSVLKRLNDIHQFTYQHIGDEALWGSSMPCMLGSDDDIPVAQYGSSNSGKMKSVYRVGLGYRYGRLMQTIAGIHYNFSVSDDFWQFLHTQEHSALPMAEFKTQGYFRLIRNFRRYFWLLLYLFGAAPAICRTFIGNRQHELVPFNNDHHSLHAPLGTSLRMGDLGYQSAAQESLVINYNCLDTYTQTLCQAITHTHDDYQQLGIKGKDGDYLQLNTNLLQIENEFYSVIRPKRTAQSGETALNALSSGGVEYIEVRCLDLNPYEPVGISENQMRFLDTFLLYCLLEDSPESNDTEYRQIQENQRKMVYQGRDPDLTLYDRGQQRNIRQWGDELINSMGQIAKLLDRGSQTTAHQQALDEEQLKISDDSLTPSARILADMHAQQITFYRLSMNLSQQHRQAFRAQTIAEEQQLAFQALAKESHAKQRHIEHTDQLPFDQYVEQYYKQYEACKATRERKRSQKAASG